MRKRRAAIWWGIAALLIAATVVGYLLPTKEWIGRFDAWIHELGGLGFVVFGLVYLLERFSGGWNRAGFPSGSGSDSGCGLAKEAGPHAQAALVRSSLPGLGRR